MNYLSKFIRVTMKIKNEITCMSKNDVKNT